MADTCPFCAIGSGAIDAEVVLEDEELLAFRDISPQAPVHILIIPKAHHATIAAVIRQAPDLAARLLAAACEVAEQEHLDPAGYRLVINTGTDGGQTVDHAHIHLLGRRRLGWPPG